MFRIRPLKFVSLFSAAFTIAGKVSWSSYSYLDEGVLECVVRAGEVATDAVDSFCKSKWLEDDQCKAIKNAMATRHPLINWQQPRCVHKLSRQL